MTRTARTSGVVLLCLAFAGCAVHTPPLKSLPAPRPPMSYQSLQPLLSAISTPDVPKARVRFSPAALESCDTSTSYIRSPDDRSVTSMAKARDREIVLKTRCARKHAELVAEARYVESRYPEACYVQ